MHAALAVHGTPAHKYWLVMRIKEAGAQDEDAEFHAQVAGRGEYCLKKNVWLLRMEYDFVFAKYCSYLTSTGTSLVSSIVQCVIR